MSLFFRRVRPIHIGWLLVIILALTAYLHANTSLSHYPLVQNYGDEAGMTLWATLVHRASLHPFHLVTALIFVLAIINTLLSHKFTYWAQLSAERHRKKRRKRSEQQGREKYFALPEHVEKDVSFRAEILHFLGEVEVIFGIWVIPLLIVLTAYSSWNSAINYIETRNYTEPMFVVVIMAVAASRPVIRFAEQCLAQIARLGRSSPAAWWITILTLGPLMGSFLTEPAAMTISAMLLAKRFYRLEPSPKLKYATLGLLFVNVSVGGVLTHFAAPPVLMVSRAWGWKTWFMFTQFGWKAIIGITLSTLFYFVLFRSELANLKKKVPAIQRGTQEGQKIPLWITMVHLALLIWIVVHAHNPIIFIGSFLLYLGFYQATAPHQSVLSLRPALLVGFFLCGLVIHAGLQRWWIEPILQGVHATVLMFIAIGLTAFNDNAAVTYLTTLTPNLSDTLKYAVVSGAVTGGGLTVIANAPNPAGQSILSSYFNNDVSPLYLFLGAALPTVVLTCCFLFLS